MLQEPVKRVEKRQRFHMRLVAAKSVAILLFTSITVFMVLEPVKRVEKRQRFHMCLVAAKSVAILLFTSITVFMVLAVVLAPVILLCVMHLEE